MAWLDGQLRPGDRFLDVGANVGIYAGGGAVGWARRGRVYAVRPNKPNAVALMQNVAANGFQDRIDIIAIPLTDAREIAAFNYTSLKASDRRQPVQFDRPATGRAGPSLPVAGGFASASAWTSSRQRRDQTRSRQDRRRTASSTQDSRGHGGLF